MGGKQQDPGKQRYWESTIREAARSGLSIREFCRQNNLKESQFYRWQRRLKQRRQHRSIRKATSGKRASFALVSDEPGVADAGIELVLGDGRRLRIRKGVDEETLRTVLAVVGPQSC
jgi:transposase-like protein